MLADRNFAAGDLVAKIAATEADVLIRVKTGRGAPAPRRAPPPRRLVPVTFRRRAGAGHRCPDHHHHHGRPAHPQLPADHHLARSPPLPRQQLVCLYHQRWEIETAYLEMKSTILGGRVLRAHTPAGITQEIYALLITCQLLHTAMADAASTRPGTDPGRASFTIAWQTARDQIMQAAGVIAGTVIDLASTIGRHVLDACCPPGGCASAPASSNAPSPNTKPAAPASTGPVTKPPWASTSPPATGLDSRV